MKSRYYLLYAGDNFYYYDSAGKFVLKFESRKRAKNGEPLGKILTLDQARIVFEDEIYKDQSNEGKLTRNGFRVLIGKEPNQQAV